MSALATAPTRTLDEALAEVLDALADARGASCVVCGERAFAVRERGGTVAHSCRSCGSTMEDGVPPFETGPFPPL